MPTKPSNGLSLKEGIAYAGALIALGMAWADLRSEIQKAQLLRTEDLGKIEEIKKDLNKIREYVFESRAGVSP